MVECGNVNHVFTTLYFVAQASNHPTIAQFRFDQPPQLTLRQVQVNLVLVRHEPLLLQGGSQRIQFVRNPAQPIEPRVTIVHVPHQQRVTLVVHKRGSSGFCVFLLVERVDLKSEEFLVAISVGLTAPTKGYLAISALSVDIYRKWR